MSVYTRLRMIQIWKRGLKLKEIQGRLQEEEVRVSTVSLCHLIKKYRNTQTVLDQRTHNQLRKLKEHHRFIDEAMTANPELTGNQLGDALRAYFPSFNVSISTVKRTRRELGWISKKVHYCALTSEANMAKRVEWCKERLRTNDVDFDDVIWTDECTVQLILTAPA